MHILGDYRAFIAVGRSLHFGEKTFEMYETVIPFGNLKKRIIEVSIWIARDI